MSSTAINFRCFDRLTLGQLKGLAKALGVKEEKDYPDWYGIKGVKFVWRNEWADPEIIYKGRRCSCHTVEDIMWDRYLEDGFSDYAEFGRYMLENAEDVLELCELTLFPERERRLRDDKD